MEKRKHILLVDDDQDVLIAFEAVLEAEGYDTTTAWSSQEALKCLASEAFDLILLDDYLPDLASDEILDLIERMPIRPAVILMQTDNLPDRSAFYVRSGACSAISKWNPPQVRESINECLRHAKVLAPGIAHGGQSRRAA